jgi:RecJ-like exonuclease
MQPAPGGTTVAAIWANRTSLAGKTVTVRGKVVKFNGGIMGRNWMHIQDGTGVAADGTNDITVTSDAEATVGAVVTVTGTVAIDKDFTAGYAYAVMIERAKIELK